MSRIEGGNINYGNSFVIGGESQRDLSPEVAEAKKIAEKIVMEANIKAEKIVAEANAKSELIIKNAQTQAEAAAEQVTESAHREGFDEGYQNGMKKIATELEDKILNVENFAKCTLEMKYRIVKSLHSDILDLVSDIANKVCKIELTQSPQKLLKLVQEAIEQIDEKEEITIIVNPEMANKIYAISNDLQDRIRSIKTLKIVEDPSVSPDGTIIEAINSRIDARVSSHIEQITQKLYTELDSVPETELVKEFDSVKFEDD